MPKRKTKKRDLVGASSKNKIFLLLFIAIGIFFTLYKLNIFAASGGRGGGKVAPTPVPLPTPPAGELLLNTSFEYNTDADSRTPDGWVQHYDQPNKLVKVDCGVSVSGKCSYYVDGKHYNAIKQYVTYSAPPGSTVTVSGWGRGKDVADSTSVAEGSFWVQAWIHYTDGSTEYGLHADFDNGTHDFQKVQKSYIVPKPVEGFTYFVKFGKTGYAWFDDVSLAVITP